MIQTDKILIEHWPLLQCVNIFIRFTDKLETCTDSITVSVTKSIISLKYDTNPLTTIDLANYFELQTHSLSLLMIEQNYVSFRLNTNTDDRFGMEYIVRDNCTVDNPSADKPLSLQIAIHPNDEFSIACDNCTCSLSKQLAFKRILELPSENLDLSEWFCHKPHQQLLDVNDNGEMPNSNECNSSSNSATDAVELKQFNANAFEPQTMDLLHGHFFVVIGIDKLYNVKQRNNTIYCRRCLQHIGEMHRQTSVKIWNENVRVIRSNDDVHANASTIDNRLFDRSTSIFVNFIFIIRKTLQDFNFAHDVGMRPMNRILFEAKSSDGRHCRYLFVQILKRNLNVYVSRIEPDELDNDENGSVIQLDKVDGMKIQFRTVEQSEQRSALLDFWQNDAGVVQFQISRRMFDEAAKRLYANSELVAECYRNSNDGFLLSYVI